MFENRVLGGMFGIKKDEVTGASENLRNEGFHKFYSLPGVT
jgi:hypothetical protein